MPLNADGRLLAVAGRLFVGFVLVAGLVASRVLTGLDRTLIVTAQAPVGATADLVTGLLNYSAAAEVSLAAMLSLTLLLWLRGLPMRAAAAPMLFLLSLPLEMALKYGLYQPPPAHGFYRRTVLYALTNVSTQYSFPSGHATRTAFMALLAAYVLGRVLHGKRLLAARFGVALLALVAGWSRVYQGFHWTSDVVGGFLLGTALACVALALLVPALEGQKENPVRWVADRVRPQDGAKRSVGGTSSE